MIELLPESDSNTRNLLVACALDDRVSYHRSMILVDHVIETTLSKLLSRQLPDIVEREHIIKRHLEIAEKIDPSILSRCN